MDGELRSELCTEGRAATRAPIEVPQCLNPKPSTLNHNGRMQMGTTSLSHNIDRKSILNPNPEPETLNQNENSLGTTSLSRNFLLQTMSRKRTQVTLP